MKYWEKLLEISDTLLGPQGCPWDREQTLKTLQPFLVEEMHELLEAIDLNDPLSMQEELGDALYTLVFIAKLAKRQNFFSIEDALRSITEKLIRRHPHVFEEKKHASLEEISEKWEEIKREEGKKSLFGGIPTSLPSLLKAQKMVQKLTRVKEISLEKGSLKGEEDLGGRLWELVKEAETLGIDAESALRQHCLKVEKKSPEMNLQQDTTS